MVMLLNHAAFGVACLFLHNIQMSTVCIIWEIEYIINSYHTNGTIFYSFFKNIYSFRNSSQVSAFHYILELPYMIQVCVM